MSRTVYEVLKDKWRVEDELVLGPDDTLLVGMAIVEELRGIKEELKEIKENGVDQSQRFGPVTGPR